MAETIQSQMEALRLSIQGLEAQRTLLGDKIVDPALAALRGQLSALEQQAPALPAEDRRMVTILFTDMVGSTSMAEKLDPEEWRRIVSKTHAAIGEAITFHHGTIAQYLGDGLLAFFGAKEAGENDPENAIRAALLALANVQGDVQAAVTTLLSEDKIQVRVGIHTGLVVVGELGPEAHKEFTASGDAMNLAARLQSAAPPGGILISHDTYRYVRGVFNVTPRPPLTVKGRSEPVLTYLVRAAKPRPFRSVARGVAGVETRTIGREAEIQALQSAYLRSFEGHGMVWVQQVGDLGIGKSRLISDMTEWLDLREESFRLLRARAFPEDANQPFALVRRMWFDRFQIAEDAPLEQAEARWVERFQELTGWPEYEEPAHALGLLVGLRFENSPHIKAMRNDPTQVKGRAQVVSRELLQAVRAQYPVVVLLEDLQWGDSASWEYLEDVLLEAGEDQPANGLFVLGAARPDWQPPQALADLLQAGLPGEKGVRNCGLLLPLGPLSDADSFTLVREILQRVESIPEKIVDLIVERSEGVPYYIEEMVNWLIDHGILDTHLEQWRLFPEKLREQPLPATLQHLLLTRLSSLSQPERATLQRGAIFGRRFWTGGLEALGIPGGAETLGHLQPRGFVETAPESAFQDQTEWSFHQNLLQEVTYESVLKRERASLHRVAASWLEAQARQSGRLEEFTGLLGEHYERAGDLSAAAGWYLLAGKRAYSQGATHESSRFYTQALELLPPVDKERRWHALLGREAALSVLGEAEPWKADLNTLLELARSFDDDNFLAEANFRPAIFGMKTANAQIIDQASQEALTAARRCGNEAIEIKALAITGLAAYNRGDHAAAKEITEAALQRARALDDESVLAYVLFRAAFFYSEIADVARCYSLWIEQIELDHRLGNRIQEVTSLGNLGSGYVWLGLYKQGRAQIEQAVQIAQALGARRLLAYNLGNLGDICLDTGDLRKARQLFEQALQAIAPTQDARGKAWLTADTGLVLLAMGDIPSASRRFAEARELALSHDLALIACEITTGVAACVAMQGQMDEAGKYAHEAWDYLQKYGFTGLNHPGLTFCSLAETFDALGQGENARAAVESGHQALMEMADTISVPEWRQSFLENVPGNRALMEMWERRGS
jgi:class 3 adenylate cyclase/tetratricopeptide (TPR) repeat protein